MGTELEQLHQHIQLLSREISWMAGRIEGMRFGRDLLEKEASQLAASAEADALVDAGKPGKMRLRSVTRA
jgi:hypothetical protein